MEDVTVDVQVAVTDGDPVLYDISYFAQSLGHKGQIYGRFPFDQKFRNEISGIPYDEWNSIFQLVGPSVPRFLARIQSKQRKQMMADSLPLLLALELFHDP